jgi:RHS repeat-associated protein
LSITNYYPFGLTFNSYQRENSLANQYQFNGKELQDELSLSWLDFGARMYMSDVSRWVAIDPLSEHMRRNSPYDFSFNNPLRFIDPDGMKPSDVIVNGMDKQGAVTQLQSGVKGVSVAMNNDGKLSYTLDGGKLNKGAKAIIKAIDDKTVTVNVNTTPYGRNSKGGLIIGGAFMGNKVDANKNVVATQEFDTKSSANFDEANKKPGQTILHEISEAYEGAKMSQKAGVSSGDGNDPNSVYQAAHESRNTIRQPGTITGKFVDSHGNISSSEQGAVRGVYYSRGKVISGFGRP